MARLYFGFQTNVEHRNMELNAPQLDTLIFETEEGFILRIGCSFEGDWGLEKDQILSGRWKGLEYSVEDKGGNIIVELTDEDNTEKLCNYLDGAKLVAFFMDDDDLEANGYDKSFIPECKNIDVDIEIRTPHTGALIYPKDNESNLYEFSFHADDLITEAEYLDTVHKKEDYEEDYAE